MNAYRSSCYLVDIDGTITDYHSGSLAPDRLLGGNFLFPIFHDLMVEQGWESADAQSRILQLPHRIIYWDYTDFITELNLPQDEAFRRMRAWHREHLFVYQKTVQLLHALHRDGRRLYVMSNNPHVGCMLKLEVAGLVEGGKTSIFTDVFGTNRVLGCKSDPNVWKRALACLPCDPSKVGTIGDNPHEDGELPRSLGIGETILLTRENAIPSPGIEARQSLAHYDVF